MGTYVRHCAASVNATCVMMLYPVGPWMDDGGSERQRRHQVRQPAPCRFARAWVWLPVPLMDVRGRREARHDGDANGVVFLVRLFGEGPWGDSLIEHLSCVHILLLADMMRCMQTNLRCVAENSPVWRCLVSVQKKLNALSHR
jgi:hypothetical protein